MTTPERRASDGLSYASMIYPITGMEDLLGELGDATAGLPAQFEPYTTIGITCADRAPQIRQLFAAGGVSVPRPPEHGEHVIPLEDLFSMSALPLQLPSQMLGVVPRLVRANCTPHKKRRMNLSFDPRPGSHTMQVVRNTQEAFGQTATQGDGRTPWLLSARIGTIHGEASLDAYGSLEALLNKKIREAKITASLGALSLVYRMD